MRQMQYEQVARELERVEKTLSGPQANLQYHQEMKTKRGYTYAKASPEQGIVRMCTMFSHKFNVYDPDRKRDPRHGGFDEEMMFMHMGMGRGRFGHGRGEESELSKVWKKELYDENKPEFDRWSNVFGCIQAIITQWISTIESWEQVEATYETAQDLTTLPEYNEAHEKFCQIYKPMFSEENSPNIYLEWKNDPDYCKNLKALDDLFKQTLRQQIKEKVTEPEQKQQTDEKIQKKE